MDGSIADSTVLRMRTGLQRMHHAAPSSGADGFLEELLKLPPTPEGQQADEVAPAHEPVDSVPAIADARPDENINSNKEEPSEGEEKTLEEPIPCVPMCYAPAPLALPLDNETVGQPAVVEDLNALAPANPEIAVVDQPATAIEAAVATIEPTVHAVDEPIDAPPTNADVVQPVSAQVEGLTQEKFAKTARELRRPKDAREKADATSARTVEPSKGPATPEHQPTSTKQVETTQADKNPTGQVQSVEQAVQPVAERPAEPKDYRQDDRQDDRPQRDKWYEDRHASHHDASPSSLVQQLQELVSDQVNGQEDIEAQATSAAAMSQLTAKAVDASAALSGASTPSAPAASAPSLMNGDIAAAAAASLVQHARSQAVTEATQSSGVDGTRGQQPAVIGNASVNTSNSFRSGTVSGSTTATSSNEAADQPREITQQERVRLVQRVARSFSRLGPEGGQVTLKLHPPQLGVLNVSIKIEGQTLTARMQTESSAARDAIIENLPLLRERLNEQGIEIEKFQVEVGQQEDLTGNNGQPNSFAGNGSGAQRESTSTEYDYRRVARESARRQSVAAAPLLGESRVQGWPAVDRSLDVRA